MTWVQNTTECCLRWQPHRLRTALKRSTSVERFSACDQKRAQRQLARIHCADTVAGRDVCRHSGRPWRVQTQWQAVTCADTVAGRHVCRHSGRPSRVQCSSGSAWLVKQVSWMEVPSFRLPVPALFKPRLLSWITFLKINSFSLQFVMKR
jgi:hypothetical protein